MLLRNQEYCVLLALLGLCIIERRCGMGVWLVWDRDDMHTDFWWGNFLVNACLEDEWTFTKRKMKLAWDMSVVDFRYFQR